MGVCGFRGKIRSLHCVVTLVALVVTLVALVVTLVALVVTLVALVALPAAIANSCFFPVKDLLLDQV